VSHLVQQQSVQQALLARDVLKGGGLRQQAGREADVAHDRAALVVHGADARRRGLAAALWAHADHQEEVRVGGAAAHQV